MIERDEAEKEGELAAFLRLVGDVVALAIRRELESFERRHLTTYPHRPPDTQDDPHLDAA